MLRSERHFAKAVACVALVAWAFAGPAAAESPAIVLKRFGLTGTWAIDCKSPASRTNFYETFFADRSGRARRDVDSGAESPLTTSYVDTAEIAAPNALRGRIRNSNDPNWGSVKNLHYDFVLVKEDDLPDKGPARYRILESVASDGRVIARDGMLVRFGKPTQWLYRCPFSATS